MESITKFLFYFYMAALLAVGGLGMIVAPLELSRFLHVPLSLMPPQDTASLSNQYRFLKALELACGCFCWWWRREIFADLKTLRMFLVILWGGVAGRLLSLVFDGPPHGVFIAFVIIEVVTGIFMLRVLARMLRGQQ